MRTEATTAARETGTLAYDLLVVAAALALTVVGTLLWGVGREALAAGLGGTLAVLNWLGLRWVGARLLGARPAGGTRRRVLLGVLFVLKFGLVIGVVWALIRWAGLEPMGLALGYSALVVGLLGAAFLSGRERAEGGSDA
ncbi:MAG: hypothetical protein JXB32_18330 [Deltaproteobacteria bacterium]|nr:hypothetical protein [Deltaproteobacteria bacterium]